MIQAIIKNGKVLCENVPAPLASTGSVLIKVVNSCISPGTEMVSYKTSNKSLIKRAMEQPHNVKKVLNMAKSDRISKVYQKVKSKVSGGKPTGYSLSGVVLAIGEGVHNFSMGDRVAAGGAGIAYHAECVDVPENLVVKIPGTLDFSDASTVTLGAIAMQGVRRADLKLGEFAIIYGTGVIGLLALQMLVSSGIRVSAVDFDTARLEMAKSSGAEIVVNPASEDPVTKILQWSNGFGADAVVFTASTTSSEPLSQSFKMCRKKGRVVLVGATGMNIKRSDIYEKELDMLMSTSYGPGRYDRRYEEIGLEYPYAYVRWTENRNMDEYLRLVNQGSINLNYLSRTVFPIEKASDAFESLNSSQDKPLTVILDYGELDEYKLTSYKNHDRSILLSNQTAKSGTINIALVGTGNFAVGMHLPNIAKLSDKFKLHAVMNKSGYKGKVIAQQYNAKYVTTNYDDILNDEDVDLVIITTRHDSHAKLTLGALKARKNVFVEKPLAVDNKQLEEISNFFETGNSQPVLMVGFNRRFSPYAQEIKKYTDSRVNPLFIRYRMNAGYVPLDHWIHDFGGRIIGEGCHIIDLMTFLTGCRISSISCEELSPQTGKFLSDDNKSFILKYEDGSVAAIDYFAVGNKSYPKEYMEVHFDQKSIVLDDYKSLKGYGIKINEIVTKTSQKGQLEELEKLYAALTSDNPKWPIKLWDMLQTTAASFLLK